jgi:acetate CoA/acetoacetate CoA-transferase beta subunit
MCVIEVREDGLWVTELHPDFTKEEVQAATEAELHWDPDCKPYQED